MRPQEPTSALEHLFIGLELRRHKVPHVVSVAPRFIGDFEKGIDFKGDLKKFEASLREHVAIAKHCGPYKISVHSGSDKFTAYPVVGRVCGKLLHVKTAGHELPRSPAGRRADGAAILCRDRRVLPWPLRY